MVILYVRIDSGFGTLCHIDTRKAYVCLILVGEWSFVAGGSGCSFVSSVPPFPSQNPKRQIKRRNRGTLRPPGPDPAPDKRKLTISLSLLYTYTLSLYMYRHPTTHVTHTTPPYLAYGPSITHITRVMFLYTNTWPTHVYVYIYTLYMVSMCKCLKSQVRRPGGIRDGERPERARGVGHAAGPGSERPGADRLPQGPYF